MHYFINIIWGK